MTDVKTLRASAIIAALTCAAILLSGCGSSASGPATARRGLNHHQAQRLLALIAAAKTQADANHRLQASADLASFSADVRSLRTAGTLTAAQATSLSAQAAAAEAALTLQVPAARTTTTGTTTAPAAPTTPAATPNPAGAPPGPGAHPPGHGPPQATQPPGHGPPQPPHPPAQTPSTGPIGTPTNQGSTPSGPAGDHHGPGWWKHHPG